MRKMTQGDEVTEKQVLCLHAHFEGDIQVNRLEDTGRFMADLRIQCADCGTKFSFKGLKPGLDIDGAAVSVDGYEARLAIAPCSGGIFRDGIQEAG